MGNKLVLCRVWLASFLTLLHSRLSTVRNLALAGTTSVVTTQLSIMNDPDGFDPVLDTVGAGIYSGKVVRDADGKVVIGKQYKNHNPHPGPVYAGGGYTDIANAIHQGFDAVQALLIKDPSLVNEIMTGGATPLHTCGMSRTGQHSTAILIAAGGDIEAMDAYGYTPLHRMASNNLPIGAEALLQAGADPNKLSGKPFGGETPMGIARQSHAIDVIQVLKKYGGR